METTSYVLQCVECGQWDFTKRFDEQFLCGDCSATDFCLDCENPMFDCDCLDYCQHCSNEAEDCDCGCCDPDDTEDIEDEIDRKVELMEHGRI